MAPSIIAPRGRTVPATPTPRPGRPATPSRGPDAPATERSWAPRAPGAGLPPPEKELKKAVTDFEKKGGTGTWFKSTDPWSGNTTPHTYYLVKSLPPKAKPDAAVPMLRAEHTRAKLDAVMKSGAPVVLGTLPLGEPALAAALGGVPLAADALATAGDRTHQNVIFLQPDSDTFVLAHEAKHWQDFEDQTLTDRFSKDMKPFFEASYLSDDDKNKMYHWMLELRGHGEQIAEIHKDREAGLPFIDGAGNTITGPKKKLNESYAFAESMAFQAFNSTYQSEIFTILAKVKAHKPSDVQKLATVMAKYDRSDLPDNPVTFAKIAAAALR